MKLTDNEINFFKNISQTEVASGFTDYLQHVIQHICDVRNFKPGDTPESVQKAATIIQELIIDKIRLQTKAKSFNPNEME